MRPIKNETVTKESNYICAWHHDGTYCKQAATTQNQGYSEWFCAKHATLMRGDQNVEEGLKIINDFDLIPYDPFLRYCPKCGEKVYEKQDSCPYCSNSNLLKKSLFPREWTYSKEIREIYNKIHGLKAI